jgi:hypothetical protein
LIPVRASSVNFISLKYLLVRELVIIIPDLYLPERQAAVAAPQLPGLERLARFGCRSALRQGWRPWLAQHVGLSALALEPPACIAARVCSPLSGAVWLATPVHCIASHAGVHLEQRGLLKLPAPQRRALAADFARVFKDSGLELVPLASGGFLLAGVGLPGSEAHSMEPARCVGVPMQGTVPVDRALQRLRAEIEIWLFEHPVNRERSAQGQLAVSALWTWGGGIVARDGAAALPARASDDRIYACDPYVDGLSSARGVPVEPAPPRLEGLEADDAARVIVLAELAETLAAQREGSSGNALLELDAHWLEPAVRRVRAGRCRRLALVANDHCITLTRFDGLKAWRPPRRGLAGLL